jgi:NAD-reducing hydrogenase large subunit
MSHQIVVEPVSRIEGHGKITITLDDRGRVADAQFHVTQFRGFEKFCEGRPFTEMPSLVERICGICPVSHALASARACDSILGVRIPDAAGKLRRLLHCGQFVQSHALSFFYLSAPDLLLGMDAEPADRNIFGVFRANPAFARDGIRLRQIGQQFIERLTGKRIHPSWVVPGGVNAPLSRERCDAMQALIPEGLEIARRTLALFKSLLGSFREEISTFASFPSYFMGMVDPDGRIDLVDGKLRFMDEVGNIVADQIDPDHYREYIGEAGEETSYLKSPYYKPVGYPQGIYRVGPAARLNVCDGCGTPLADLELEEFRQLEQGPVSSSFHNHYARLIEIIYALETMGDLLSDPGLLSDRVRSFARPNFPVGVGAVEAPRGTLLHHYTVDQDGLLTWANMIVATGNNNLAMNRGVLQVAGKYIRGKKLDESSINRLQAVIRAFDPCLSCSTHALLQDGSPCIRLIGADGQLLDEV